MTALALLTTLSCESNKTVKKPRPAPPPPTFTGPSFLHGTIGSLATLRGYQPLLVSGFGVVANLPGTGSSEVPAFLRQRMLNEARLRGWGSANLGTQNVSPQQFLASPNTAIVSVEGLIAPGAKRGTSFDVLVTALDSQTTSLEDGSLYTLDLGVGGTLPGVRFARPLAKAAGPTYLNPFEPPSDPAKVTELRRQVVVLAGGTVTQDRKLELVLNQASWQRSRLVADRINERFARGPNDRNETAVAKTDLFVELNVPQRFSANPQLFLDLVSHLFVQRAADFERQQAQVLADTLLAQPRYAATVSLAWRALGPTTLVVLSRHYDHENLEVRLAALEAGAALGDESAGRRLAELSRHSEPTVRRRVARLLVNLPRSLQGSAALRELLDDEDRGVRIEAYRTLAAIGDPLVQRTVFTQQGQFKFALDLLPAEKPLIYVVQSGRPRVVIFNKNTSFAAPLLASVWDGRLRIRCDSSDQPASVFYQGRGQIEGRVVQIAPTVANLAFVLAHEPSAENPSDGLALSYANVVHVIHALCRTGQIPAPIELELSPLASAVVELREQPEEDTLRPESAEPVPAGQGNPSPTPEAAPGSIPELDPEPAPVPQP